MIPKACAPDSRYFLVGISNKKIVTVFFLGNELYKDIRIEGPRQHYPTDVDKQFILNFARNCIIVLAKVRIRVRNSPYW